MSLFVRLVRAQLTFGIIFASYMVQLVLVKVFRTQPGRGTEDDGDRVVPAWLTRRQARIDDRNAERMLSGMLRLRGVYIKLGQVLSIMGGFLPPPYIKRLETLQDAVPPHRFDEIEAAFVRSLGAQPEAFFRTMDREPVAAASLGQVHVAYMDDGRKVAVKVLYPGIRDVVRVDMRVIKLMVRVYKWFVPVQNIEAVHESLALTKWYAQEHVLLCLIPAFFIAGAIGAFVRQATVMKYLGAKANRIVAYGVASTSGSDLRRRGGRTAARCVVRGDRSPHRSRGKKPP